MTSFEIERIMGHQTKHGKTKFLVRFANLTADEDTWVQEDVIKDSALKDKYFESVPDTAEYKIDDFSFATNDVLTLQQLLFKDPIMIVAAYKKDNKLYYRVEFKKERFYSVESSIMKKVFPQLVVDFLVNKIQIVKK